MCAFACLHSVACKPASHGLPLLLHAPPLLCLSHARALILPLFSPAPAPATHMLVSGASRCPCAGCRPSVWGSVRGCCSRGAGGLSSPPAEGQQEDMIDHKGSQE